MDTRREPTLAQTEDARFVAKLRADPLSVVTSQPLISKYHQNTAPFHQRLVWHGSFPNKICYRFEPCLSGSAFICSVGFLRQIITTPSFPKINPLDISFPNSFLTIKLSWGQTEQRIKEESYDMIRQVVRFLNPFPAESRQGTSFQYQKSHLDLVVWYCYYTATICQLIQFYTNSEAALLSTMPPSGRPT